MGPQVEYERDRNNRQLYSLNAARLELASADASWTMYDILHRYTQLQ